MREMKDSGIEWIGRIPINWQAIKLKYLFGSGDAGLKIGPFGSAMKGKTLEHGPYKIYNQAHLIQNDFNLDRHYVSEDTFCELKSYEVKPGDILFSMMGTIGKCQIMPEGYPKGIMDSHLLKTRVNEKILARFLCYAYDKDYSDLSISQLLYASNGTIMSGLNSSILKNVFIALPSIEEQKRIVDYLDSKCSNLDSIITKQEAIIEKLKEYKLSVITEAVIKGLKPDVEVKDSGIEWVGLIPKDWSVCRVKDVCRVERGGSPRPIEEYLTDKVDGLNWIKIGDTTKGYKYIDNTAQRIIKDGLSKTRYVEEGTLLLTNSMSFGEPYILRTTGCIHDGWLAFSEYKGIDKEYLYYYFCSSLSRLQFKQQVAGGVVQNLNIDKVKATTIFLPGLDEQKAIVEYLDSKCAQIDKTINDRERAIGKLLDYKKSLIFEVVTGKKEV